PGRVRREGGQERCRWVGAREEDRREERRQGRVEIEVVPLDDRARGRGTDDEREPVRRSPASGPRRGHCCQDALLRNRAMHVAVRDATTAFDPPAPSVHHLPAERPPCPEWRYLGPSSVRRQGAHPRARPRTANDYSSL